MVTRWIYLMLDLTGFVDGLDVGCEKREESRMYGEQNFVPYVSTPSCCPHGYVMIRGNKNFRYNRLNLKATEEVGE